MAKPGSRTVPPAYRILVVDGDRRVRSALCNLLVAADDKWEIASVADPVTAEADMAGSDPDMVLVNVSVTDAAASLALISSMRDDSRGVIAISAADSNRSAAMSSGASAFLPIGASADAVLGLVRSVAARTQTRRPRPAAGPEADGPASLAPDLPTTRRTT